MLFEYGLTSYVWHVFLTIYLLRFVFCFNGKNLPSSHRNQILMAGLFPIHSGERNQCGSINIERGIHRWQAMLYAVDQINKKYETLKNHTVIVEVFDTCQQETLALDGVIKIVVDKVSAGNGMCRHTTSNQKDVVAGVIGAASSSVSIQVANLLRLFKIPQISYASTSALLNDRQKYNFFTRTVPPDTQQASAMMDLANYFNWTAVMILYSEGSYGESGFEALKAKAKLFNICIAFHFKLGSNVGEYESLVDELKKRSTTRVVILFLDGQHIKLLLEAAAHQNAKFTWVASDYWGSRSDFLDSAKLRNVANGALTLTLKSNFSLEKFRRYFCKLKPDFRSEQDLPNSVAWFNEYWIRKYNCSSNISSCTRDQNCANIRFDDKVPYVIDSVYALTQAMDSVIKKLCDNKTSCENWTQFKGEQVRDSLMNGQYNGIYGLTTFDETGSANHGYDIMQYINGSYFRLGGWKNNLSVTTAPKKMVKSFCSQVCRIGFVKRQKQNSPKCCHTCFECGHNQYAGNITDCYYCSNGHRPNATRNGCEVLPIRHLAASWVTMVAVLAGVGIIATLGVILIFVYYKNTEIVQTSAPELSFPLLVGVLLCYILTFIIVADQTDVLCGMQRFGLGFCLSICYGALLTKTNRLSRVFNDQSHHAPRFITASAQIVILCGLVFVECALATIGLYNDAPRIVPVEQNKKTEVFFLCKVPLFDIITSYAYNFVLVAVCTLYAVKTRHIPACFNEARYLGFVMYITCIIWLSFIPLYSVDISKENVVIVLCFNIILNATTILAGLFGPKLYVITCHPSRNKRTRSTRSFLQLSQSMDNSESCVERKMTTYSLHCDTRK